VPKSAIISSHACEHLILKEIARRKEGKKEGRKEVKLFCREIVRLWIPIKNIEMIWFLYILANIQFIAFF
jgi:hypothetical protein